MNRISALGIFLLATGWVLQPSLVASSPTDFRVETDVTTAEQAAPIYQSVTIFSSGVAYDYSLGEPHRIVVIAPGENRVVFLDSKRGVKTEIHLDNLTSFLEEARKELANSKMAAALEDANLVHVDPGTGVIMVGQNFFRYQAIPQKLSDPSIAKLFAQFADVSACINAWRSPDRSPPSFARMKLNQALADQSWIPQEIVRTTVSSSGHQSVLKSRVHASWQLSDDDKRLVENFRTMVESYWKVEVKDYFATNLPPAMSASSGAASSRAITR